MAAPKKKSGDKKQVGRPLEYTKEMGDYICELVASTGHGLLKLTTLYPELPDKMTINRWRHRLPEFRAQYAQAKIEQADILAEECLEIADDSSGDVTYDKDGEVTCNTEFIARSRLRVDTRKWLAAKLLPRQYGDPTKNDVNKVKSFIENLLNDVVE
tara:strand:+ start:14774 stop:15244 length:471 start_codon:yes stop_codon:yes gene_type:complete